MQRSLLGGSAVGRVGFPGDSEVDFRRSPLRGGGFRGLAMREMGLVADLHEVAPVARPICARSRCAQQDGRKRVGGYVRRKPDGTKDENFQVID